MKRVYLVGFGAFVAISLAACQTGVEFTKEDKAWLKPGKTSVEDVTQRFGPPLSRLSGQQVCGAGRGDGEMLNYMHVKRTGFVSSQSNIVSLSFDGKGRLCKTANIATDNSSMD